MTSTLWTELRYGARALLRDARAAGGAVRKFVLQDDLHGHVRIDQAVDIVNQIMLVAMRESNAAATGKPGLIWA